MHDRQLNRQEKNEGKIQSPRLEWDIGTAYDFFISLVVLHDPEKFGLRPSWAAGVRSRLTGAERKVLEETIDFIWVPLNWIYQLPQPKDVASVLWALRQVPVEERLITLSRTSKLSEEVMAVLKDVSRRRQWDAGDLEVLRSARRSHEHPVSQKTLTNMLDWWSRPEEFGELYLSALQSYQQVFFAEEEKRINARLWDGLDRAKELAEGLSPADLVEELSQGVHFDEEFDVAELVLAPTYWSTPLVLFDKVDHDRMILMFGVRPADASLVPGEQVPDALLQALKAMADPTRLRILRYLSRETLTPADLARRLRLRAPTVTHHLSALRLAGLVRLNLELGGEKRYTARLEGISSTFQHLTEFLENNPEETEG